MSFRQTAMLSCIGTLIVLGVQGDRLRGTQEPVKKPAVTQPKPPPLKPTADKPFPFPEDELITEFPVGGECQTAWKVRYIGVNPGPGLVLTGAWVKTAPDQP